MLERIRRERGSGSDFLDLKTGTGGIIEAEFLVQALQMREGIWEQNWERAVDRLYQRAHLAAFDVDELKTAYGSLRHCELVLRRYENRSVSTLPSEASEQRKFAIRLGYREFDEFRRRYVDARDAIHALYERRIRKSAAASARRASHPPSRSFGVAGSEAATGAGGN
jgi:glutamine synthetase adenylyltransferase